MMPYFRFLVTTDIDVAVEAGTEEDARSIAEALEPNWGKNYTPMIRNWEIESSDADAQDLYENEEDIG